MKDFDCPVCHSKETHICIDMGDGKKKDWLLAMKNPTLGSVCVLRMCKICGIVVGHIEPFETSDAVTSQDKEIAAHVKREREAEGAAITKEGIAEPEDE